MGRHSGPARNEGRDRHDNPGADRALAASTQLNGRPADSSRLSPHRPDPAPGQGTDPGTGTWAAAAPVPPPPVPEPAPPEHSTATLPAVAPAPAQPSSYLDASGLPQQVFVYEFDEPPPAESAVPATPPWAPAPDGHGAADGSPSGAATATPTGSPAADPFDPALLQPLPPSAAATGPERLTPVTGPFGPTPPAPTPPAATAQQGPTMLRRAELPAQRPARTAPSAPPVADPSINGVAHPANAPSPPPSGQGPAPEAAATSTWAPAPSAPHPSPGTPAHGAASVSPAPTADDSTRSAPPGPATTGTLPRVTGGATAAGGHRRIATTRSDSPAANDKPDKSARKQLPWVVRHSTWRESLLLIAVVLVVSTTIKLFLVQAFFVPSGSMEDTIKIGDRVVVDKLTPWFGATPQRGEVIVFRDPGGWLDPSETGSTSTNPFERYAKDALTLVGLLPEDGQGNLIKRVIGVPGDHIVCCDAQNRVTINGVPLSEPYTKPDSVASADPLPFDITVPPGRLFVMGDNRGNSRDSRWHLDDQYAIYDGTIPMSVVVGRADAVVWPIGDMKTLSIPDTFHQNFAAGGADMPIPTDPATASVLIAGGYMAHRRRRERRIPVELTGLRPERVLRPRRTGPLARRARAVGKARTVRRRPTLE